MPEPAFLPFAAHARDYPRPRLSLLPAISSATLLADRRGGIPSAFHKCGDFFIHSRYALAEALRRSGVGAGTAALMPAYHCRTTVDAATYVGAEVRFYRLTADLRPDFSTLPGLNADGRARALVLTHYFGFGNDLAETDTLCQAEGLALIEDCAHAYYGEHHGRLLGTVGQFATASVWKFLPVPAGAVLRDSQGEQAEQLRKAPLLREMKAVAAMLQGWKPPWGKPATFPKLDIASLATAAQALAARGSTAAAGEADETTFLPDHAGAAGPRVCRWLASSASPGHVARQRRHHFQRWLAGIRDVPGIRPLFPALPDGVVPYAFPLLADAQGLAFHALRLAGIPIWRWEDMAAQAMEVCPVSRDYRLRLLQLPCHQELSDAEMDWMMDVVRRVLPEVLR
jgi:hypothetical protein